MQIGPQEFGNEVANGILEIGKFVQTPEFQRLLFELRTIPVERRVEFVESVVLNRDELAHRGIETPCGMVLQRSYFADNRPTLFCVTKKLSQNEWKVTITFDAEGQAGSVPLAYPPLERQ
jgi:hypothetical protein